ncbi:hypothetical protein ZWY2020_045433 [Hordeum vulgare]|nr:hypothetical protein ZWY2020_045433 [Hordeum vulgare]
MGNPVLIDWTVVFSADPGCYQSCGLQLQDSRRRRRLLPSSPSLLSCRKVIDRYLLHMHHTSPFYTSCQKTTVVLTMTATS